MLRCDRRKREFRPAVCFPRWSQDRKENCCEGQISRGYDGDLTSAVVLVKGDLGCDGRGCNLPHAQRLSPGPTVFRSAPDLAVAARPPVAVAGPARDDRGCASGGDFTAVLRPRGNSAKQETRR
jgi:hypothetical protein